MSNPANTLGGRLALLAPSELTPEQFKIYDGLQDTFVVWADKSNFIAETADKRLIGPFNPMLRSPLVTEGFLQALGAEAKHNSLSEKVRQVIILSVGPSGTASTSCILTAWWPSRLASTRPP